MAQLKQKRINFFMSSTQFREMEEIISPNEITQSNFIRKAIEERIEKAKKEQLEKELEEGYKAMAKEHKQFAKRSVKAAVEIVPPWK